MSRGGRATRRTLESFGQPPARSCLVALSPARDLYLFAVGSRARSAEAVDQSPAFGRQAEWLPGVVRCVMSFGLFVEASPRRDALAAGRARGQWVLCESRARNQVTRLCEPAERAPREVRPPLGGPAQWGMVSASQRGDDGSPPRLRPSGFTPLS